MYRYDVYLKEKGKEEIKELFENERVGWESMNNWVSSSWFDGYSICLDSSNVIEIKTEEQREKYIQNNNFNINYFVHKRVYEDDERVDIEYYLYYVKEYLTDAIKFLIELEKADLYRKIKVRNRIIKSLKKQLQK